MKYEIIRRIDKQGRITMPKDLLDLIEIKIPRQIFLCSSNEGIIMKNKEDISDTDKIIGIVSLDHKGRFILPKYLREKDQEVVIFVKQGMLMIKEAS